MIVTLALLALRAVTVAMFATTCGAVAATGAVMILGGGDRSPMVASFIRPSLTIGAVFLVAALGGVLLLPSRRDLLGQLPPGGRLPSTVSLLLAALAVVALIQAPVVWTWIRTGADQAAEAMGRGSDPLGWRAATIAFLSLVPALGALTILAFIASSAAGLAGRAELAGRVLQGGLMLQGGLIAGAYLLRREMISLGAALRRYAASSGDLSATAGIDEWLSRYDLIAGSVNRNLLLILGGYFVALAVYESRAKRVEAPLPAPEPAIARRAPDAPAHVPARSPGLTAAFPSSMYTVRPRIDWIGFLIRQQRYADYDIQSIPPSVRDTYSFTWRTGIVRREPNGPDLVSIAPPQAPGRFLTHEYVVHDATTGGTLGRLVPRGTDWEILEGAHRDLHLLEVEAGLGYAKFVLTAGGVEACRFGWALQYPVTRSELDIEFLAGAGATFDRALAIALGPILEQRARLVSNRKA